MPSSALSLCAPQYALPLPNLSPPKCFPLSSSMQANSCVGQALPAQLPSLQAHSREGRPMHSLHWSPLLTRCHRYTLQHICNISGLAQVAFVSPSRLTLPCTDKLLWTTQTICQCQLNEKFANNYCISVVE